MLFEFRNQIFCHKKILSFVTALFLFVMPSFLFFFAHFDLNIYWLEKYFKFQKKQKFTRNNENIEKNILIMHVTC
jgi:hypothetical protein